MTSDKLNINQLRYEGLIKGNRPFICEMAKNTTIFFKRSLKYIISYRDNTIYFQSLNYFTEKPNNKYDYAINIKLIESYDYRVLKDTAIVFTLTLKKGLIVLLVALNNRKRVHSQVEFADFVEYLKKRGIKDEAEED